MCVRLVYCDNGVKGTGKDWNVKIFLSVKYVEICKRGSNYGEIS